MDIDTNNAWNTFEKSGKINDYLSYVSEFTSLTAAENSIIKGDLISNGDYNGSDCDKGKGI
ncbi:MAG: hypothetical protein RSD67_05115 [Oscillospiraceae bacterium]